ncbi:MAG: hypothetical protein HWE15_15815 [Algoriphagus sp.]|uniref:hypothetical protein n=1 Tax=Algoriphagus sp. TaxID=1872435 RepID=UPI0017D2BDDF|nr:hypothetical protein [Algoriphagus sp.]NVJ87770.1 hypothetical protein [Algoriphagus sp.]
MKNRFIKLIATVVLPVSLFSCASNTLISNGGYSDVSLNSDSDQFEIKRLKEVSAEGNAIFGIPFDKKVGNKSGLIVRFNGVTLNGSNRVLPILSLVGLSIAGGAILNNAVGYKSWENGGGYKLGLAASSAIVLPVTGIINNQIWGFSAAGRASQKLNRQLVEDNPNVDVFLNPKYSIDKKNSLWTQKAEITVRTMGATLKVD